MKKQNADLTAQKTPKQQAEVAEAAKKQKPSILQSLPLIGEFLKGQVSLNCRQGDVEDGD